MRSAAAALANQTSPTGAARASDPLAALMAKAIDQTKPSASLESTAKPASLEALIASADKSAGISTKAGSAKAGSGTGEASGAASKSAEGGAGAGKAGPTGNLFAQIEPCWRRAIGVSSVPVTLEITLDRTGRLTGAPKVAQATGEAGAQRMAVERALQAVAACLPYKMAQGANPAGVYRVAFRVAGS